MSSSDPALAPSLDIQLALLKKHWGFDSFKPAQADAIGCALLGLDVLAVLATGYGKSAIFQIVALSSPGCCLVISPLIALMQDQVTDCEKRSIPASFVNSQLSDDEVHERLANFAKNKYKVFYIAPERLNTGAFKQALATADVNLVAVDEAHCVSRLGHDFRPAYQQIKWLAEFLTIGDHRPPIMAVTATATLQIEQDIAAGCGMAAGYKRIVGDPVRPNLTYEVRTGGSWRNLTAIVRSFDLKGRHVIYAGTRKGAEKIVEILVTEDGSKLKPTDISFYHAGMDKFERDRVQNAFKEGKIRVVVATCAFGMGIDVPDIRTVIHFGIPGCVEDYVQESGRAGRDGKPASVILVCEGRDDYSVSLKQRFIEAENPPYEVYEDLWSWLHEVLKPAGILALSGTDIAKEMFKSKHSAGARSFGIHTRQGQEDAAQMLGSQILGALSTMEAYGLVKRGYMEAGTSVTVDVANLEIVGPDCTGHAAKVIAWLNAALKDFMVSEQAWKAAAAGGKRFDHEFDRPQIATELGLSEPVFLRTLKALETADVLKINKVYQGKTTQVLKWGAKLSDIVPRAKIDDKRARAYERLESMLRYMEAKRNWTAAPGAGQRPDEPYRQFIRNYFLAR